MTGRLRRQKLTIWKQRIKAVPAPLELINRGISGTDTKILGKIKSFGKPIMICLNKEDLPRNPEDLAKLEKVARTRLQGYPLIKTAFDPDPRLCQATIGCRQVYDWIRDEVQKEGKSVDGDNFPPPPAS